MELCSVQLRAQGYPPSVPSFTAALGTGRPSYLYLVAAALVLSVWSLRATVTGMEFTVQPPPTTSKGTPWSKGGTVHAREAQEKLTTVPTGWSVQCSRWSGMWHLFYTQRKYGWKGCRHPHTLANFSFPKSQCQKHYKCWGFRNIKPLTRNPFVSIV